MKIIHQRLSSFLEQTIGLLREYAGLYFNTSKVKLFSVTIEPIPNPPITITIQYLKG